MGISLLRPDFELGTDDGKRASSAGLGCDERYVCPTDMLGRQPTSLPPRPDFDTMGNASVRGLSPHRPIAPTLIDSEEAVPRSFALPPPPSFRSGSIAPPASTRPPASSRSAGEWPVAPAPYWSSPPPSERWPSSVPPPPSERWSSVPPASWTEPPARLTSSLEEPQHRRSNLVVAMIATIALTLSTGGLLFEALSRSSISPARASATASVSGEACSTRSEASTLEESLPMASPAPTLAPAPLRFRSHASDPKKEPVAAAEDAGAPVQIVSSAKADAANEPGSRPELDQAARAAHMLQDQLSSSIH
jgi:hypothetical protein